MAMTQPTRSEDWAGWQALVTRYSRALDTRDYGLLRGCFSDPIQVVCDLSTGSLGGERLTPQRVDPLVSRSAPSMNIERHSPGLRSDPVRPPGEGGKEPAQASVCAEAADGSSSRISVLLSR
jgi:hypothetical protein